MKNQIPASRHNRFTPRFNKAQTALLGGLLAAGLAGGILNLTVRRGGDARSTGPTIAAVEPNHRINASEIPPAIPAAEVSDNYNLAAPNRAPDGHSELVMGASKADPHDTELFMSVDNGKTLRPVVSGATDAVWAPKAYVVNGQDTAFAALYNNPSGAGTPNVVTDQYAPDYADDSNYVGLYGVNANGTVTETAAAQCIDTSLQPVATPVGEDIPYSWGDPVRNRAGQLVGKFSVFQLIGGENPDGSMWYGGELDNSVAGPVQR